jgi:hypothetical protein
MKIASAFGIVVSAYGMEEVTGSFFGRRDFAKSNPP